MLQRLKVGLATAAVLAAPVAVIATAVPADAAGKYYSSCDKLHRDYRHGVARSAAAARKQVRDGYGRPAYGKRAQAVYQRNNSNLDRDKDGTACEA